MDHKTMLTLAHNNFVKFRMRLQSSLPQDIHRTFSGFYYPDSRTISVAEMRTFGKTVRLLPIFEEACYIKENGDTFVFEDFEVGNAIRLGETKSLRDMAAIKTFVVTEVDLTATKSLNESVQLPTKEPIRLADELRSKFQGKMGDKMTIKALGGFFRIVDNTGERKLAPSDLRELLKANAIDFEESEIDAIVDAFDRNKDGYISYKEFLRIFPTEMNEVRQQAVLKAFTKMDYNKNGFISIDELASFYNGTYHPKVQTGELESFDTFEKLCSKFEFSPNGQISFEQFEDYFNALSATVPDDEEFMHVMNRAWNLDNRNLTGVPFH